MNLRFFADQCVPMSVVQTLREAGYEVLRLKDFISTDSPDSFVISKAQQLDAILLSLDGDFADIVNYPPSKYKGILALQVRNHPETIPLLLDRLKAYLLAHDTVESYSGMLPLEEPHRLRSRS